MTLALSGDASEGPWTISVVGQCIQILDTDGGVVCEMQQRPFVMENAKLISAALELAAAVKPLAEKWLYPDDLDWIDPDTNEVDDDAMDDVWIKRGAIRAARLALKKAGV